MMASRNCSGSAQHLSMEATDIFCKAVEKVLTDEIYTLQLVQATSSLKAANQLHRWCMGTQNKESLCAFAESLVAKLESCFQGRIPNTQARRERMWAAYHQLRTLPSFRSDWEEFLEQSTAEKSIPILYQHITDVIFNHMIVERFPIGSTCTSTNATPESLSYTEGNALRYVAGYTIRAVRKKLAKSSHPSKEDLVDFLSELVGEENHDRNNSEDWIHLIDRGGLLHVKDGVYDFFKAVEEKLREYLKVQNAHQMTEGIKREVLTTLVADEDILFYWCMLTVELDEDEADVVLRYLVSHWVTVRGFSFASSVMEIYKQAQKKLIQRSKGLRKELFSSSCN